MKPSVAALVVTGAMLAAVCQPLGASSLTQAARPAPQAVASDLTQLPLTGEVLQETGIADTLADLVDDDDIGDDIVGEAGAASSTSSASRHYGFLSRQGNSRAPVARWNPCTSIGYRVNPTGGGSGATAEVKVAAARLRASTGLPLVYRGTTRVVPGKGTAAYPNDTQIVIAWSKPGVTRYLPRARQGQYAVAGYGGGSWSTGYDAKDRKWGRFVRGYVVLNGTYHFAHGFGAGPRYGWQGTRGQLIMHELGHAVGLDHTSDRSQIMYPTMTRKRAVYGAGDRTGLRYLGRANGCLYLTPR
ncbi:matrixin family metalloprotease [Angustibacter sp. McL0619]|uniref:matrixin family metalloprotease n=1 Tax=Angustibacter sp. McL0619 TaxID=3415676 RepID=UPI003CEF4A74